MKNKISAISEKLFPSLMDFCKKIIQTPSLSGQEASVAKLISEEMQKLGYDEVFTDEWGNVIGIVKGAEAGPTIMYNGHMDTVPIGDLSSWGAYDPYGAEIDQSVMQNPLTGNDEKAEVIHGRGSGDLKCNLASQIYAGAILTAVVLEENGEMMGTIKLCEETLPNNKIDVDAMVCCEPSSLRIMLGHRGRMEIRVTISGRSCHGSSPWLGINAVEKSAKFIVAVQNMFENKTLEDPFLGKPGIALTMYHCEPNELCIVPDKCTIIYDRRLIPGETTESAIAEIQQVINTLAKGDPDFDATVEINKNQRTIFFILFMIIYIVIIDYLKSSSVCKLGKCIICRQMLKHFSLGICFLGGNNKQHKKQDNQYNDYSNYCHMENSQIK